MTRCHGKHQQPAGRFGEYGLDGTLTTWAYDIAGRLSSLAHLNSTGTTLSSFNYSLDNVGNRLGVVESTGDRVTWTYDDSYQLTREQRAGATSYDTTFIYDAVGNRTLQVDSGARTTYSYDAANQLITENSGTVMTYTFDGDGNLSGRLDAGLPSLTITWDYEDRMTAFTLSDVPLTDTADYDPDYRRVRHRWRRGALQ